MAFEAVIELSGIAYGDGSLGFVINGIDAGDMSALSVASAGDVNGDGFGDLIIGARGGDPAHFTGDRTQAGETYIVFGSPAGFSPHLNLSALDGSNGFVINGQGDFDLSGWSVAGAGDVNGDGFDDAIISAPQAGTGLELEGETYVVFGSAGGFSASFELADLDFNAANGFIIDGVDHLDQSGWSVAGAGDVNGDGIDDMIIGARQADGHAGATYVVFGSVDIDYLDLSTLDGSNGFVINGIDTNDLSGFSVASAGDVNGDGIDDIIVGAPQANGGVGETYVVFGTAAGFTASLELSALNGGNGFVINGIGVDDSGTSIASAGDVNGDGIDDMIIGAPQANGGAGATYVVFGRIAGFSASLDLLALDGTNGFVINGISAGDVSGFSVSSAGDVNGDGIDDMIIGAPQADSGAGITYVVFGGMTGFPASFDLVALDGTNGFAISGIDGGDTSGISVAGAGDFNGDGYDDLIVGAHNADPGGQASAGETYVIYGRTSNQTEGTSGDDVLFGAAGEDALNGYAGNDTLLGDDRDDRLDGGDGNDRLRGGLGADALDGGLGDDTYLGVGADDLLLESADAGIDTIETRLDNYLLPDNFENLAQLRGAFTSTGNALDNTMTGADKFSILDGGEGNDTLDGRAGTDELDGGIGDDLLIGGLGRDTLLGRDGNDRLDGGVQRDVMTGGLGADRFVFAEGDFQAVGFNSADAITDFSQAEGDTIDLTGVDADSLTVGHQAFTFIGSGNFTGTAGEVRYDFRSGFTLVKGDTDGDAVPDFVIRLDGVHALVGADFVL